MSGTRNKKYFSYKAQFEAFFKYLRPNFLKRYSLQISFPNFHSFQNLTCSKSVKSVHVQENTLIFILSFFQIDNIS